MGAETAERGAHEREARQARVDEARVQPEGLGAVAEQRREGALGVRRAVEDAMGDAHAGGRLGRRGRRRAPPGRSRAAAGSGREGDEVRDEPLAVFGPDRFGMELHTPRRPAAVADRQERAVVGPRDGLERRRQGRLDDERVVAHGAKALRDAVEERVAVVEDRADAPVHDVRAGHDAGAREVGERLVAEADAEHRHRGLGQRVAAHAEVALALGPSGARRDDDPVPAAAREPAPRQLVVAHDLRLLAGDGREELIEVEGVRVVVVDEQRRHRTGEGRP
jgi:hypothetical protein